MEKITVKIDKDLMDIIPAYLEHRRNDCKKIRELLAADDKDEIKRIGHKMAGSGGGYGFDEISKIGKEIENNALTDKSIIENCLNRLESYLDNLDIVYE